MVDDRGPGRRGGGLGGVGCVGSYSLGGLGCLAAAADGPDRLTPAH